MHWGYLAASAALAVGSTAVVAYIRYRSRPSGIYSLPIPALVSYLNSAPQHAAALKLIWAPSAKPNSPVTEGDVSEAVCSILLKDGIPPEHPSRTFAYRSTTIAAMRLRSLANLLASLESRRAEAFDPKNRAHVAKLERLWSAMKPAVPCPPIPSQAWTSLGFQGRDPATDFRGGGVLSLDNLLTFAQRYPLLARGIAQTCEDKGIQWFTYAITGINITVECLKLARSCPAFFLYHHAAAVEASGRDEADDAAGASGASRRSSLTTPQHPLPDCAAGGPPLGAVSMSVASGSGGVGNDVWVDVSEYAFQDLYALVFASLHKKWADKRPPNVMAFGKIFPEVCAEVQALAREGQVGLPPNAAPPSV